MGWRHGIDPPWWWRPWCRLAPIVDWWQRPRPVKVRELSRRQGRRMFDRRCREQMGISGAEFLRRFDAGEIDRCDPGAEHLVMLIPFAR